MIASLKLAHERGIENLAHGKHVDLSAFAKIIELLKQHEPPIVPKVSVEFVQGVTGRYRCTK